MLEILAASALLVALVALGLALAAFVRCGRPLEAAREALREAQESVRRATESAAAPPVAPSPPALAEEPPQARRAREALAAGFEDLARAAEEREREGARQARALHDENLALEARLRALEADLERSAADRRARAGPLDEASQGDLLLRALSLAGWSHVRLLGSSDERGGMVVEGVRDGLARKGVARIGPGGHVEVRAFPASRTFP